MRHRRTQLVDTGKTACQLYIIIDVMSHSQRRPLWRSNIMTTANGTPPEIHWWAARVLSNLDCLSSAGVYQDVVSSWDQEDDQPTNWCAWGAPCAQEHHSQSRQCVQKQRCDGPPGLRPMARDLYVPARRHYWLSQISKFSASDADIWHISCGRPQLHTLD